MFQFFPFLPISILLRKIINTPSNFKYNYYCLAESVLHQAILCEIYFYLASSLESFKPCSIISIQNGF